ncbi:MAG: hypothetical protein NZ853_00125 [Leptospiraceae bacterium]|nr:hypothetical protein [Leptospiraceae bacterium]MDW7976365.1 hypothetical protein [Leptospiraceae bacterium]
MTEIKIWHFSKNLRFPLKIKVDNLSEKNVRVQIIEEDLSKIKSIDFNEDEVNILVFQSYDDDLTEVLEIINKNPIIIPYIKVVILPESLLEEFHSKLEVKKRTYVLDDQTKSTTLKVLLEFLVKSERYRKIIQEFSTQVRKYRDFLEGYIQLIRTELLDAKNESRAYQHLLEFEQKYRVFEEQINKALEEAFQLKEKEMIELHSTIKALERLGEFRDRELMETRKSLEATEIALEISRQENIEREKIIEALQRLNIITDAEIIELYKENQELRKKLGLPPRESYFPKDIS